MHLYGRAVFLLSFCCGARGEVSWAVSPHMQASPALPVPPAPLSACAVPRRQPESGRPATAGMPASCTMLCNTLASARGFGETYALSPQRKLHLLPCFRL